MLTIIEQTIIAGFFIWVIYAGIQNINKIENVNVFAVGRRSFSTFNLWGTITATWISGSMFFVTLQRAYFDGLKYYLPSFGMILALLIISIVIAPRVKRFLGKTSVAEVIRQEYGEHVGSLTALAGFIGVSGMVAIQFKVFGQIGVFFFAKNNQDYMIWILIIISAIVIFYTTIGGIQSVVKTDVIQLVCFFLALPLVGGIFFYIFYTQNHIDILTVDKFNITKFIYEKDFEWLPLIYLTLYFAIPGISPNDFQRLTMGLSTKQSQYGYLFSALSITVIKLILLTFPILLYCINQNLDKTQLLPYILKQCDIFPLLKPILALGIISMAMSTADSFLNIGGVLIANDFYFFKHASDEQKLINTRICVIILGILAIILAILKEDLLNTILFSNSFYIPIITPILLALFFGFKTTERCALFTMFVILLGIVIYKIAIDLDYNIIPPAMLLNIIILFSTHYIVEKWELLRWFGIRSKLKEKS